MNAKANPKPEIRKSKLEAPRLTGARTFLSAFLAPGGGRVDRNVRAPWLAAALLLLATSVLAPAQTGIPAVINYQGMLTDNLGNPITNGYYEVQFRIWDDPAQAGAGDYIWGRAFPLHVVTNGMFNVLLSDDGGVVNSPAPPQTVDILQAFTGPDRYLGLTVTRSPLGQVTSPVEISPRQRLVSAPYAMHAQNATTASSLINDTQRQVVSIIGTNVVVDGSLRSSLLQVDNAFYLTMKDNGGGLNPMIAFDGSDWVEYNRAQNAYAFKVGGSNILQIKTSGIQVPSPGTISGYGTIPLGGIIMWSGAIANIPSGWALCNGQTVNNQTTPDLRERFIVGAGNSYAVKAIGGSQNVTLSVSNLPAHNHTYADSYFQEVHNDWRSGGDSTPGDGTGGNASTSRTTDSNGSGLAFDIRPPYYALAYIMRVQ